MTTAPIHFEIMTNSLPDHCYYAENNQPYGSETNYNYYFFKGIFNLPFKDTQAFEDDDASLADFTQTSLNQQTDVDS